MVTDTVDLLHFIHCYSDKKRAHSIDLRSIALQIDICYEEFEEKKIVK